MTRVLALDLDGTLLRSDTTISAHTMELLRTWQERGNRLVIATGRPPRLTAEVLPDELQSLPWICYNGAEIRHQGQKLYQNYIPVEDSQQIARFLQEHYSDLHIRLEVNDHVLTRQAIPQWDAKNYTIVERLDVVDQPCAKVIFWTNELSSVQPLIDNLPPSTLALISHKYNAVEILSRTADKAAALRILLNKWGLTLQHVIAVGDNVNDLQMIRLSGMGVAVENAVAEVKAVADHITASNDNDGVASLIEKLI